MKIKGRTKWLTESNCPKHILVGFFIGLTLRVVAVFTAAASAEMKDWLWNGKGGGFFGWIRGNGGDWLDFIATMIGGIVVALFRYLVLEHVHL